MATEFCECKVKIEPEEQLEDLKYEVETSDPLKLETTFFENESDNSEQKFSPEECKVESKYIIEQLDITDTGKSTDKQVANTEIHHCPQCPYKTVFTCNYRRHVSSKHTPSHLIKWFHCAQCTYKSKQKQYLERHISNHHSPNPPVKCPECDFSTRNPRVLKQHVINKHTPEDFEWYRCEHCAYKAKTGCNLQQHVLYRHTSEDSIKWQCCDHCPYKGKTKRDLLKHVSSVHTKPKEFICGMCCRGFSSEDTLRKHNRCFHNKDDL